MEWYERWGVAGAALKDAFSSAWDIVHDPDHSDPNSQKGMLGLLVHSALSFGDAAYQAFATPVTGIMEGAQAVAQPVQDTVHRLGATLVTADKLTQSPTWQAQEGITSANSPLGDVRAGAFFNTDTWSKAWDMADNISIGQALAFNGLLPGDYRKTDILNQQKIAELKDSVLFNATSGLTDAAVDWYSDPIAGGLKAVGAAKKVNNVFGAGFGPNDPWLEKLLAGNTKLSPKVGIKPKINDPELLSRSDAADSFLHWAVGRPASEIIRHPMIAKMANKDDGAGIIASLIGKDGAGDVETARKVLAVGYGSTKARDQLLAMNNDLSIQITNIENLQNPTFRKALAERDPSLLYTDAYLQNYLKYEEDLAKGIERNPPSPRYKTPLKTLSPELEKNTRLQKALTAAVGSHEKDAGIEGMMINQVPKARQVNKANKLIAYDQASSSHWNEAVFPKPFAPALKVVGWASFKTAHAFTDKRPPSWIDPNRKDASAALWAYMKTSKAFDDESMKLYSDQYLNALDISSRRNVINRIESQAIINLAQARGLSSDVAKKIAKESLGRRNTVIRNVRQAQIEGRIYGLTDKDGNAIRIPRFETQEVNSIPLLDLEAYRRIFKKHTDTLTALGWSRGTRGSGKQFLTDSFDVFNSVWSAVNLLRPGYTIRNVTDDTLRSLASLGALNLVGQISKGVKNGLGNVPAHIYNTGRRSQMLGDVVGEIRKGGTKNEIANRIRLQVDQMGRDLHSLKTQSNDGFIYDGHAYNGPYSGKAESYQRIVGSSFNAVSGSTRSELSQLRKDYAQWEVLDPEDPGHLAAWTNAIHNQIGKSEIGKRFLQGDNAEEVKNWLQNTAYGRATLRKLGSAGKDVDSVVGQAQAITDYIVPLMRDLPDPWILRKMAANGEVDENALQKLFPDVDTRPQVHGPTIDFNISSGPVSDAFNRIVDTGFKWFGEIPTDKLVRHPTFRSLYVGNIRRLHNNMLRQKAIEDITDVDFAKIEHASREMSLKQMNDLLFDGSTKSNISHRLRFMTGFFSAWEDSMTKWARIAYDKPQTLVNAEKLWNAPNQVNLGSTYDPYDPNKRVPRIQVLKYDPETGKYEKAPKNWDIFEINDPNIVIQARLPEFVKKYVPYMTDDDGNITIAKSSLNLSLQGDPWWLPGAGPFTNIVVSKYVMDHPTSLPEVYKWAIPYGAEDNVIYGLLPAWSRRLWTNGESVTNGTRASTMLQILQTQTMKLKMNKRKPAASEAAFMKEIEDRTDQFFKLRAFTSFFSPVAVQYNSPFKFYIDQYRALKAQESQEDVQKEALARAASPGHWVPTSADEKFLDTYGEDFYGFATAVSRNNLGLPASAEAWNKSQTAEVQKYIQAGEPEKAALLVGHIGDTQFDQYVYDAQFHQHIGGPMSDQTAREHQSPDEAIKQNDIRLGWTKYTQMMDLIDAYQDQYDPEVVDKARTIAARSLATKYDDQGRPTLTDWGQDFYESDPEKIPSTIRSFTNFLNDNEKLVMNRPDLRVLAQYLTYRQSMLSELEDRKAKGGDGTLIAKSNQDLAQDWKNTQVGLAESNTQFGRIFWRYLSNDRLQTSNIDKKEDEQV
jgi:hypothetical protein